MFTVAFPSKPTRYCGLKCAARARSGVNNCNYNGGLSTMRDGRTVICCRDGSTVYFYRAVMEAHLGRPLRDDEIVHHVNGDKTDDRIENLELTTRAEHIEMHRDGLHAARGIK